MTLVYYCQTQVIAAAAAGVAAEGLSPKDAKAEAENAAQLSVSLVENAIVILMLVEDHLRLQSKLSSASSVADGYTSPLSLVSPLNNRSNSLNNIGGREPQESKSLRGSISSEPSGLPLDVCLSFLINFQHIHRQKIVFTFFIILRSMLILRPFCFHIHNFFPSFFPLSWAHYVISKLAT